MDDYFLGPIGALFGVIPALITGLFAFLGMIFGI